MGIEREGSPISLDSMESVMLSDGGEGSRLSPPPGRVYGILLEIMVKVSHGDLSLGQISASKILSFLSPMSGGVQCGGIGYLETTG